MYRLQRFIKLIAFLVILGAVVLGFVVAGSPQRAREFRADEERVQDLEQIRNAINAFFTAEGVIPESLEELRESGRLFSPEAALSDPVTNESYGYRVLTDTTLELCAAFSLPGDLAGRTFSERPAPRFPAEKGTFVSWDHPAGRYCFILEVIAQDLGREP